MAEPAVEILRGQLVESVAYADVAVVDSLGRIVAWAGDPERATFWRSSAKPFQAMPLLLHGAVQEFGLSGPDLAILTASHGGEPRHLERVSSLLSKISADPKELACGVHWPSSESARRALQKAGAEPTVLHNNCSGKHTGMLMLARRLGVPSRGYLSLEHPVQQRILQVIRQMTGIAPHLPLQTATDGCGAPTFYLPLARMAFAYARLVDPRGLDFDQAAAATLLAEAIRTYPELVSGEGRLEVRLSEATDGRFVAKGGAEAVFALGVPERGWGIAIKMADGNSRTLPTAVVATLLSLDLLEDRARNQLHHLLFPVIKNHAGNEVGGMRPVLDLHRAQLAVKTQPPGL